MSAKLSLTILLLSLAHFSFAQRNSQIHFFLPDDWQSGPETPLIKPGVKYFGIFENKSYQQTSIVIAFHGKDSIFEGMYGPVRRLVVDSIMPTFVVSGLNLKHKAILRGVHHNDHVFPGESIPLHLGNWSWVLYASGNPIPNSQGHIPFSAIKNYKLILRRTYGTKTVEQVLGIMDVPAWGAGGYEGGFFVKWIGDLNGDNALDILLMTSTHYAGYVNILYMGIPDGGGVLVKEVGRYDVSTD